MLSGTVEEFAEKLSEKVEDLRTITHAYYFGKFDLSHRLVDILSFPG